MTTTKKSLQCAFFMTVVCALLVQLFRPPISFVADSSDVAPLRFHEHDDEEEDEAPNAPLVTQQQPLPTTTSRIRSRVHNKHTNTIATTSWTKNNNESDHSPMDSSLLRKDPHHYYPSHHRHNSNYSFQNSPIHHHHLLPHFCLVHVGKTAGGSVSCRLGGAPRLAKQCPPSRDGVSSLLEPYVLGKLHKLRDWGCFPTTPTNKKKKKMTTTTNHHYNISTFLFTLRDPMERIRSWFYYEHPSYQNVKEPMGKRRDLFWTCNYTTLDELAEDGLGTFLLQHHHNKSRDDANDIRTSPMCAQRAWNAVTGQTGYLYHNKFNYQYYYEWTQRLMVPSAVQQEQPPSNSSALQSQSSPQLRVLVIRQEHLSEDWNSLEEMYSTDVTTNNKNNKKKKGVGVPKSKKRLLKSYSDNNTSAYFDVVKLHQVSGDESMTQRDETMIQDNHKQQKSRRRGSRHRRDHPLSPTSWPNLCQALCRDILVYRELLERAENLQSWQKDESLQELTGKCPEHRVPRKQVQCHVDPIQPTMVSLKIS
jgi:hypothetical protein